MMDGMEGAKCTTLGSCFLPLVMAAHGAPWSCTAHFPVHTSHPSLHSMSFLATSPLPAAPLHPVPSWSLMSSQTVVCLLAALYHGGQHRIVLPDNGACCCPCVMKGGR